MGKIEFTPAKIVAGVAVLAALAAVIILTGKYPGLAVYTLLALALAGAGWAGAIRLRAALAGKAIGWKIAGWAALALALVVVVATLWWLLLPLVGLGAAAAKAAK